MAEKREISRPRLKTSLETLLMKLDQIGHFIVCVSYKWYRHSNDFNLFLRLALGDLSLSVFTFFSISLLSFQ